ncbi:MAG: hypothetical protein WC485_07335 [Opitutaceae bacterium]
MSAEKPLVYLVLGAAGSGRRGIVADLLDGGLAADDQALTLLPAGEPAGTADARLGRTARWAWTDGRIEAPDLAGATHVFFLADGRRNPVDQVEAFQPWLAAGGGELARILCVIHCGLAAKHQELRTWFDACVHFADVVLFNRREGLANKWLSDFQAHYAGLFLPCLFEPVKAGRVQNPALILEPQARRLSHFFDAELNWEITGDDEEAAEGDEEVEAQAEQDPYLERRPGGRRVKVIPDIAGFLPPLPG